jgi:hypothetical protein
VRRSARSRLDCSALRAQPGGRIRQRANAVLVLLGMLLAGGIYSVFLLARTIRDFRAISTPARIAGIGPSVVLVGGLAGLVGFLRY